MSESFAELFEESLTYIEMTPGSLVSATIVDVTPDFVTVSAGLKSEGVIPAEEFKNEAGELIAKVGDVVEVALDSVEDGFGETKLSREKARRLRAWEILQEALDNDEIITGFVSWPIV